MYVLPCKLYNYKLFIKTLFSCTLFLYILLMSLLFFYFSFFSITHTHITRDHNPWIYERVIFLLSLMTKSSARDHSPRNYEEVWPTMKISKPLIVAASWKDNMYEKKFLWTTNRSMCNTTRFCGTCLMIILLLFDFYTNIWLCNIRVYPTVDVRSKSIHACTKL